MDEILTIKIDQISSHILQPLGLEDLSKGKVQTYLPE